MHWHIGVMLNDVLIANYRFDSASDSWITFNNIANGLFSKSHDEPLISLQEIVSHMQQAPENMVALGTEFMILLLAPCNDCLNPFMN